MAAAVRGMNLDPVKDLLVAPGHDNKFKAVCRIQKMVNSAIARALVQVDGEGDAAQEALYASYSLLYDILCKELGANALEKLRVAMNDLSPKMSGMNRFDPLRLDDAGRDKAARLVVKYGAGLTAANLGVLAGYAAVAIDAARRRRRPTKKECPGLTPSARPIPLVSPLAKQPRRECCQCESVANYQMPMLPIGNWKLELETLSNL